MENFRLICRVVFDEVGLWWTVDVPRAPQILGVGSAHLRPVRAAATSIYCLQSTLVHGLPITATRVLCNHRMRKFFDLNTIDSCHAVPDSSLATDKLWSREDTDTQRIEPLQNK